MLVDYLEESAEYLKQKYEHLERLEAQYIKVYDRDIKREVGIIKGEIRKKKSEITSQLLLNLEEFRYLNKYFPDLLNAFIQDKYIGKYIAKKSWLLNYKPLPPQEAAKQLEILYQMRTQLKDAKKFLRTWVGTVNSRAFCATFPVLKGEFEGKLEKDEVIEIIEKTDKKLIKKGWLLLITDSLIHIPLAKFSNKLTTLRYDELSAKSAMKAARGRGTVAEASAIRKYEKVKRQADHYENILIQILLANPEYVNNIKKNKNWLSRVPRNAIEKLSEKVTPRKVKERAWLNKMNKKLSD
ncbi:hypothetical protein JXA56_01720 [Candidatus Micrarchaeota archaeon]|nr:hypothetical protein [Candidatus Micrarchaeota archaeon]